MKKDEFLQLMDWYGINLSTLSIYICEISGWEGDHGVYEKDGQWYFFSADGRSNPSEDSIGTEDDAFDELYSRVFVDLMLDRFITKAISEDIVKIDKETVCQYIKQNYSMTDRLAEEAWEKLKTDMHVLFEFKYYIKNDAFVPEKYAYRVEGYSAEQLYNDYGLKVIGAFNYLIYLRDKPKLALEHLKKGLPVRTVFSENKLEEVLKLMEEKKNVSEATEQTETEVQTQTEVQTETEAQPQTEPQTQTDAGLLEQLAAIQKELADLRQTFEEKIATDQHKDKLFDNMHSELVRYQNGAHEKVVDSIALDIIQLVDTTKGHANVYGKKEPSEENYKKLLKVVKGIIEDLEDILYRQNIEPYRVSGHEVDVRRQKIIQSVPTDDKSKDNLVAVRVADGYEKGDKVFRPERIKIFKYE